MSDRHLPDELLGRRLIKLFKPKEQPPSLLATSGVVPKPPFSNPMSTEGSLIVGGESGAATELAVGAESQVLTVVSGVPAWADPTGGTAGGFYRAYVLVSDGSGGFDFIDDGAGNPVESLEALEP